MSGIQTITLELPGLLCALLDLPRTSSVPVAGSTLADAIDAVVTHHPRLRIHLLDDTGGLRPHVLCFHNGTNTRWTTVRPDARIADGDTVTFMQAVSGG